MIIRHGLVRGGLGFSPGGDGSVIEDWLRGRTNGVLMRVAGIIAWTGVTPNALTVLGFLGMVVAGVLCARGSFFFAGIVVAASCAFDALDGALARASGAASVFGAFLDSFLDRYAEAAVYAGLLVHYAGAGPTWGVWAAFAAAIGSLMVSYARARAEGLGVACRVGSSPGLGGARSSSSGWSPVSSSRRSRFLRSQPMPPRLEGSSTFAGLRFLRHGLPGHHKLFSPALSHPSSCYHSLCEPSGTVAHNYIYISKITTTSSTIYFLCLILQQLSSLPSPISSNRPLKSNTSLPRKHPSPPPSLPHSSTGSSLSKPSMQLLPGTRASGG